MSAHDCPRCSCPDGPMPQPASSNDQHRRAVIAGAVAVLEAKKRAREDGA